MTAVATLLPLTPAAAAPGTRAVGSGDPALFESALALAADALTGGDASAPGDGRTGIALPSAGEADADAPPTPSAAALLALVAPAAPVTTPPHVGAPATSDAAAVSASEHLGDAAAVRVQLGGADAADAQPPASVLASDSAEGAATRESGVTGADDVPLAPATSAPHAVTAAASAAYPAAAGPAPAAPATAASTAASITSPATAGSAGAPLSILDAAAAAPSQAPASSAAVAPVDPAQTTQTTQANQITQATPATPATPATQPTPPAPPSASAAPRPAKAPGTADAGPVLAAGAPAPASAAPSASAAPVSQLSSAPAPLAAQVTPAVLSIVQRPAGTHQLTLTVNPDSLGPVTVRAHIGHAGEVQVELLAATDLGREAVRTILTDLRRDLAATMPQAQLHLASALTADAGDRGTQPGPQGGAGQEHADAPAHARPQSPAPANHPHSAAPAVPGAGLDVFA